MYLTEEILENNPTLTSNQFEPSFNTRQQILSDQLPLLAKEASLNAIQEWGRSVSDITHLVFATTSGVWSPTPDCVLAKLLGLNPNVSLHFVFHRACSTSVAALRLAKDLAENNAGARVLVVCIDNMAVKFSAPSPTRLGMLIGHAIFSDAATAAIVGSVEDNKTERPLFTMVRAVHTLAPNTEDLIVGSYTELGLVYTHSPKIPSCVERKIEKILEEAFALIIGEVGDWNSVFCAVHPGGRAILDHAEERLGLEGEWLWASRRVLSEYGNTWAASGLLVLDEMRKKEAAERKGTTGDGLEWGFVIAFGPGFTVETIVPRSVAIS